MNKCLTSVGAVALIAMLSACGGEREETVHPAAPATEGAAPAATPAPGETPAPDASPTPGETPTPGASPTEAASPSPAPSAAPSRSAAPTPVAAASPPAMFAVCGACHSTKPGDNGIGPSLAGIYGEKAGAVPGFDFSEAMKSSGLVWNEANLDRYLKDPKGTIPGNKMAYAGLKNDAQRQAVVDYLKSL